MKLIEWGAQFGRKFQEYLNELGELGETTASSIFGQATGMDGNSDVTVSREPIDNTGFRIVADGEDAAFMEFGTGVYTSVTRPTVQADYDISGGSWSAEHNGPFSMTGHWYYNRQEYIGTTPYGAMQEACAQMEIEAPSIAGRVFNG